MRKLATIQRVSEILPIKDAEKIEVAKVMGWYIVVERNKFKPEDLVIFYEVDSFLPILPEYEFLRKSSYKKLADGVEGFRLKTIRLRGQISQGLIMPLNTFLFKKYPEEGEDVTSLLGVIKYDPPIPACLSGEVVGPFPGYLSRTDEIRIQAHPNVLERHKGKAFVATEKLDGTSCTVYNYNEEYGVCSRELNLVEKEDNTFWRVTNSYNLREKLKAKGNYGVQGEIIGEGIQGNKYKLRGQDLFVFNVYNIDKRSYLNYDEFKAFCSDLGLKTVPTLYTFILGHTVDDLVASSKFFSTLNDGVLAEGIVFRPLEEGRDIELGRLSFKAISPEFLIKFEE